MEIVQAHLVEQAFGRWPSFHDAEVISIELRRGNPASLSASIHVRKYAPAHVGTAKYEMALTHDFIISFEFHGISEVNVNGFNHQNVIDDLSFAQEGGICKVIFASIYGVECSFFCTSIRIVGVVKGSNT